MDHIAKIPQKEQYCIMFVCHGNICRSPMAEMIFRELVKKIGVEDRFQIASSATSSEEIYGGIGNTIYPPAQRELAKRGIPIPYEKRAVQLTRKDYDAYDLFLCMDNANLRNIYRIFGDDPEKKTMRLMDLTDRRGEVDDPWYSGRFDIAFDDIYEGCAALLNRLLEKKT